MAGGGAKSFCLLTATILCGVTVSCHSSPSSQSTGSQRDSSTRRLARRRASLTAMPRGLGSSSSLCGGCTRKSLSSKARNPAGIL